MKAFGLSKEFAQKCDPNILLQDILTFAKNIQAKVNVCAELQRCKSQYNWTPPKI